MRNTKISKKTVASLMTMMMTATMVVPTVAMAAPSVHVVNKSDQKYLQGLEQTGSMTIHKYDMTTAKEEGVDVDALAEATGEKDTSVEDTMKKYAIEGVEFTYLYCGQAETYSKAAGQATNVEIIYEVPDQLCKILGLKPEDAFQMEGNAGEACTKADVHHYSSTQINEALKAFLEGTDGDAQSNKLAKDALEDYVQENQAAVQMKLTDANGETTQDNMDLGLYLVVESKVPENVEETVNPWFVSLPFTDVEGEEWKYDVQVYPKNQTGNPTLDKYVRNRTEMMMGTELNREDPVFAESATASTFEQMDFILVSKLPYIHSKATYLSEYQFVDTLSSGLYSMKNACIAFYTSEEAAKNNELQQATEVWDYVDATTSKYYEQKYVPLTDENGKETGETQLTVSITEEGLKQLNESKSEYWMVVYYKAVLVGSPNTVLGDAGNENDVVLSWKRTSQDYYDTLEDHCLVYTYGLDVTKLFSDGKGNPENVKFILFNNTDQNFVKATADISDDGQLIYYVTGYTADESEATQFQPDSNGKLFVFGVEADSYDFIETETDHGYGLLKQPVKIEIHETEWAEEGIKAATAAVDAVAVDMADYTTNDSETSENGSVVLNITNHKSFLLPQTGGKGIFLVTIAGVMLVGAGWAASMKKDKTLGKQ